MRTSLKADLAILSITVIWGSSFVLMKNTVHVMGVFAYLTMRFAVAAAILAILFHKPMRTVKPVNVFHGFIIGVFLAAGMSLQVTGLKFVSASTSAFVTGMNVVMVPILSALILRKRPPLEAVAGVLMATAGLFILTGGCSESWNLGDTLTVICAFCFSLQIIFIDKFNAHTDPRQTSVIQMVTATLLYGSIWFFFEPGKVCLTWPVTLVVLYTGALGTAFAFAVQTIAQGYTSPTRTALIISCEPVFGALFAFVVPGTDGTTETLTLAMVAGSLLILGGTLLSELNGKECELQAS